MGIKARKEDMYYLITQKGYPRGKLKLVKPQDKIEAAERSKLWTESARW